MKGKIMNTENNATEAVREEAPLTPRQVAEEFVKESSVDTIIEELVNNHNAYESMKKQLEEARENVDYQRRKWASLYESIEEFLKERIQQGKNVSVDDLKELAEELDIELTKTVKVTFTVEVETTIDVPIDFDEDTIDDSDFEVSIDFTGHYTDVETSDDWDISINDFNIEEA